MGRDLTDKTEFSTLVELVHWRANREPDAVVYTFLSDNMAHEELRTVGDLKRKAMAIAARLQQLKNIKDSRILLIYSPGLQFIEAFFGCIFAGAVAVPVYLPDVARLSRSIPGFKKILKDSQPDAILTSETLIPIIEQLVPTNEVLKEHQLIAAESIEDVDEENWNWPKQSPDDIALIQYTSGTTNKPKGVMISHSNLLQNLHSIHYCMSLSRRTRGVFWLPPYHDMGLIGAILGTFYSGQSKLMSPLTFLKDPMIWLREISEFRATISGAPNFAYELCMKRCPEDYKKALDLSSWEVAFCGAELVRHDTLMRFSDFFASCGLRRGALFPCYGLAESTLFVSGGVEKYYKTRTISRPALKKGLVVEAINEEPNPQTYVSCGSSLPNHKIEVVNPETTERCAKNTIGEIWISGPSVAQGYWKLPAISKAIFKNKIKGSKEGPFLRTGDLGFIDGNELYITGRLKDVIIVAGRNHHAEDIEKSIWTIGDVLRMGCGAAFSVESEGLEKLVIVQEINKQKDNDYSKLVRDIRKIIAKDHGIQVHDIAFIEPKSIFRTSSGKIQRHLCKQAYLDNKLDIIKKSGEISWRHAS